MGTTKERSENLIYLLIWLIVCSLPVFTIRGDDNFNWARVAIELFRILPFMLIFIINNSFLVPQFLLKGKNIQYLIIISISIVIIAFFFDSFRIPDDFARTEQTSLPNGFSHVVPPPEPGDPSSPN